MYTVFRQIVILMLVFSALNVLLLLWARTGYRYEPLDQVDTREIAAWRHELKYYTYPVTLMNPERKLILLGSSNVMNAFLPGDLSPLVQGYTVFNLAKGSANVAQIRREVEFVLQLLHPESIRESLFVVGIWYGLFFNSQYPDQPYFLFRQQGDKRQPVVPYRYLPLIITLSHPYIVINHLYKQGMEWLSRVGQGVQSWLTGGEWPKTPHELKAALNAQITSEDLKLYMLQRWGNVIDMEDEALRNDLFEKITHDQLDELDQLIQWVERKGSRIILVDLPLAQWHRERSSHFKFYQERKQDFLARMQAHSDMIYINLQEHNNQDQDFYDGTHLKPKMTLEWSRQLANALHPILVK